MRIGIIRTVGSPCRCAEAIIEGLNALGHTGLVVDSEEIEQHGTEMAAADLVIDHTDTYKGRGLFRPLVRLLLEVHGARIVGSEAKSCFLADDKIAAKSRLAEAGISIPPGIVINSKEWEMPPWLHPPLVLKPAFEHMSRGLRLAQTEVEAREMARQLLESLKQPLLAEIFIPGRELAVSLLDGPNGLEMLPPLEWRVNETGLEVLSEAFKLIEPVGERREAKQANLTKDLREELEALTFRAFRVLGLRDYARFDIRLSSGGTFFFLEANTTPSLEPMEALALSARWAGLDYPGLVERILSAALKRYQNQPTEGYEKVRIDLPTGMVELEVPRGVHIPPPSSIELACLLDVTPGEDVLELGCGTGLLSIAAARLGARRVTATDIDPKALDVTLSNAHHNRMAGKVKVRAGSWFEALEKGKDSFDVIIATPPQTPGPVPFGPRYGGWDGTKHLFSLIDSMSSFLKPNGRLWLLALSLANPSALWSRLKERFSDISLVHETERPFTIKEYEAYAAGLFDHFRNLQSTGRSEFREVSPGHYAFRNLFIRAKGYRPS
jgi:D-alanine-D-alanine ligase